MVLVRPELVLRGCIILQFQPYFGRLGSFSDRHVALRPWPGRDHGGDKFIVDRCPERVLLVGDNTRITVVIPGAWVGVGRAECTERLAFDAHGELRALFGYVAAQVVRARAQLLLGRLRLGMVPRLTPGFGDGPVARTVPERADVVRLEVDAGARGHHFCVNKTGSTRSAEFICWLHCVLRTLTDCLLT